MPDFTYTARDGQGQKLTGQLTAATQREALAQLAAQSLFPLEVRGAVTADATPARVRRVPAQVMAMAYGQLADLLQSGVPLLKSLGILRQQARHPGLIEVLSQVHRRVEEGASLAEAMARYPKVFGEMAINMIRAGSEGGFLEDALTQVAAFTENQDDFKKRTIGALAYPVFLGVVGSLVVAGLMIFFVPRFEGLFASLRERGQLPVFTDWLLATSSAAQRWAIPLLALAIVGGWFSRQWLATEPGRVWRDRNTLRIPVAGRIMLNLAVARFCRVLGTLLHNGVPILRSLEISSEATGNRILTAAIQEATENISAGQSLAAPLSACGHFPPMVVEMIVVAEEANTLEKVLLQIAESLERRTWRQLDLAVRLLEPIMLLLLAGVVLVLVVALLLPVLRMSTTI